MINLPDNRQLIQSPQDDAKGLYLDWLNSFKTEVLIVDYSFNLPDFVPVIQEFIKSGVKVYLVLDKSQAAGKTEIPIITQIKALATQNPELLFVAIGTSSVAHAIMHDKFSVGDHVKAQYGSWNYTVSASKENNFYFLDPEPVVARAFEQIGMDIYNWIIKNEPQTIEHMAAVERIEND